MGRIAAHPASPGDGFEEFYRYWVPQLRRFLAWYEADQSITEDAVQETMLYVYRTWPAERNKAWLFTVVRQRLSDEREKRRAENLRGEIPDRPTRIDDLQRLGERLVAVELVRKLPEHQIAAIVLYFYGFKDREIGEMLGLAEGSVCTYRSQGLRTLRTMRDAGEDGGIS